VVPPRGSALVTVDAIDPDGDALFYRYQAESGTVTADPAKPGQATYVHTGGTAGSDRLTVTVTDSRNTSASLARTVSLQGNRNPEVSVRSIIDSCHPPCRITYTAQANDAEGDELHYTWSGCTSGTGLSSACFLDHPGPVTSAVTVTDGQGGLTTVSVPAQGTNQAPTIRGVQDSPQGVPRLLVFEDDADGDRMICGWWGNCQCTGSEQSFNLNCTVPSFAATCFQRFRCTDTFGALGEFEFNLRR
jgi:Bacterial Ig domain